ncbi:MAG: TrmB family transcriptional regulator [Candidatus Woesearchaeota archaeon]
MNLKELGLSEYEEKTYLSLIKLGKSTASAISRDSGVSYGKIYEILASLENKGLAKVIPETTKKFIASNPENLMKLVNKKEEELLEIKKGIQHLEQIYTIHETEPVVIVKGKNNFNRLVKEQKKSEKYSYTIKFSFSYKPEFVRGTKESLAKKTDNKVLGRFDNETMPNITKWKKINPNIKPIENNGVAMSIQDDEEVMIALIKSNTSMLIRDKPFAQLMKTLFLNYYEKN